MRKFSGNGYQSVKCFIDNYLIYLNTFIFGTHYNNYYNVFHLHLYKFINMLNGYIW